MAMSKGRSRKASGRSLEKSMVVSLRGLAHGGMAFGKAAGRVLFVPYSAPGDRARVRVTEEHPTWARAEIEEVLSPSPARVAPSCPSFGRCAGCQLQHIRYEEQVRLKQEVVRDQLARLAKLTDVRVNPVVRMDDPWEYRNHAPLYPAPDGGLGIQSSFRPEVVAVHACPLFHPLVQDAYDMLDIEMEPIHRITLRAGTRTGDQLVVFETTQEEAPHLELDIPISCALYDGKDVRVLIGDAWVSEELAGQLFRISALSPFPPNTDMAEAMLDVAFDYLSPRAEDILLDAGCGVGVFGLSFAGDVAGVVGIEENEWGVQDFVVNAGEANAGILYASIADGLAEVERPVDLAIVSPAWEGLGGSAAAHLARLGPRRLIHHAPDPAVLARDAVLLQDAGFHLIEVQPFDLLPHTYHISTLSLWE